MRQMRSKTMATRWKRLILGLKFSQLSTLNQPLERETKRRGPLKFMLSNDNMLSIQPFGYYKGLKNCTYNQFGVINFTLSDILLRNSGKYQMYISVNFLEKEKQPRFDLCVNIIFQNRNLLLIVIKTGTKYKNLHVIVC